MSASGYESVEAFRPSASDLEKLQAESVAAHARIDAAADAMFRDAHLLDGYLARKAPQRAAYEGDAYGSDPKAELDRRIRRLLEDIVSAQSLAGCLNDPREKRLIEALIAMPGSGE